MPLKIIIRSLGTGLFLSALCHPLHSQIDKIEALCQQEPDSCLYYLDLFSSEVENSDQFRLNMLTGTSYLKKGAYQAAIDEFLLAERLLPSAPTSDKDSLAYRIKNNLGICQDELGNDRMAEKSFFEALTYISKLPDSLEHIARVYTNLAILYNANGNLEAALNYTEAAIEIGPVKDGEEVKWKQIDQLNLFGLYYALGDFRTALGILREIQSSINQIDPDILSDLHFNFGLCHQALQNYDSAIVHFEYALQKTSDKEIDLIFRAHKYLHLADAYQNAQQLTKAINLANKVSALKLPPGPAANKILAKRSFILGQCYSKLGEYNKSLTLYANAWEQINEAVSSDHFSSENLKTLLAIARIYASHFYSTDPSKCVEIMVDALSYFNLDSILHSEAISLKTLNHEYKELYQNLIRTLKEETGKAHDIEELIFKHYQKYYSFQLANKLRSRSLKDIKDKSHANLPQQISDLKAKISHLQLNQELDSIASHLTHLRTLELALDLQNAPKNVRQIGADFNNVSLTKLKDFADAQQSVFVFYILSGRTLTTMTVDSEQLKVYFTDLPKDFEDRVRDFNDAVTNYPQVQLLGEEAITNNLIEVNLLSLELYDLVLGPIFPIKGNRIIIGADDILSSLPFTALSLRLEENQVTFSAGQFVINQYEIAYFNPFGTYNYQETYNLTQVDIVAPFSTRRAQDIEYFLPGSHHSIAQIEARGVPTQLYEKIDKPSLRELMQQPHAVHFATHAESSESETGHMYLLCGPNPSGLEDRLYRDDLSGFSIRSPLVTLAGCQTGLGPQLSGQMESMGLSFLLAGTSHLLTTLWHIDDRINHTLMADFYAALNSQESTSAAYTSAIRTYLRKSQDLQLHPFHWAGFQLFDAGSKVKIESTDPNVWWYALGLVVGLLLAFTVVTKRKRVA